MAKLKGKLRAVFFVAAVGTSLGSGLVSVSSGLATVSLNQTIKECHVGHSDAQYKALGYDFFDTRLDGTEKAFVASSAIFLLALGSALCLKDEEKKLQKLKF